MGQELQGEVGLDLVKVQPNVMGLVEANQGALERVPVGSPRGHPEDPRKGGFEAFLENGRLIYL